jgi:hypothetical protein
MAGKRIGASLVTPGLLAKMLRRKQSSMTQRQLQDTSLRTVAMLNLLLLTITQKLCLLVSKADSQTSTARGF